MSLHDLMIILVLTFPMFIFTIFPGIKIAEYLQDKYEIKESYKRGIMLGMTFLSAFFLSTILYLS